MTEARPLPSSLALAIKLMYAGAVATVVVSIANIALGGAFASYMRSIGFTPSAADSLKAGWQMTAVLSLFIGTVAWLGLARLCQTGRRWARVASTVVFAADVIGFVYDLIRILPWWARFTGIPPLIIGLAVIILLWRRDSGAHFRLSPPKPVPAHPAPRR